MKVTMVLENYEHDGLDAVVFFDDGLIGFCEEKAWSLIGGDGAVLEHTWKEEPQSAHYKAYCEYAGPRHTVPEWKDHDTCSPFSWLVFEMSRRQ